MTNDLISAVQSCVDKGIPARSVPFDWEGKRYWIKIALESQRKGWHRVQDVIAFLSRAQMLRSSVSASGQQGLGDEAKRLERVAKRGVLVPRVVAQSSGWLLLSDIGPCLFDELQKVDDKEALLQKAVQALASLHQKGGWHGTGQLRDMILTHDGQIGFIDFEEAVGETMCAPAAQARDILRFLISAVRFDKENGQLLARLLATYRAHAPTDVWPHIRSVLRLMAPFGVILGQFQSKLGRDLREGLMVFQALKPIVRQP